MNNFITDAVMKKISDVLNVTKGIQAVFGDPVELNGRTIIPVARISIRLGAASSGGGGGDIDGQTGNLKPKSLSGLTGMLKGSGSGQAGADIQIEIEPVGFIRDENGAAVFQRIE